MASEHDREWSDLERYNEPRPTPTYCPNNPHTYKHILSAVKPNEGACFMCDYDGYRDSRCRSCSAPWGHYSECVYWKAVIAHHRAQQDTTVTGRRFINQGAVLQNITRDSKPNPKFSTELLNPSEADIIRSAGMGVDLSKSQPEPEI